MVRELINLTDPTNVTGISIIVCCHNSADRLPCTLRHLAALSSPKNCQIEILLVDNGSTDNTAAKAKECWDLLAAPFQLKIISETNLGLANARKAGCMNSRFDIGIFCDDDNWLPTNYARELLRIFQTNPKVGVVGTSSVPVAELDLPHWFYRLASKFGVGDQGINSADVTFSRGFVWGAGMGVRLDVLKSIYLTGVSPLMRGRHGADLTSGDDAELCCWMILAGYRIWYEYPLCIKHYMPSSRLSEAYKIKFQAQQENTPLVAYFALVCFVAANQSGFLAQIRLTVKKIIYLIKILPHFKLFIVILGNYNKIKYSRIKRNDLD